jgi:hypothetical protein
MTYASEVRRALGEGDQQGSYLYAYFQVCREGRAVVVTVQPPLGGPVLEAHNCPRLELVTLCTLHTVRAMHTL